MNKKAMGYLGIIAVFIIIGVLLYISNLKSDLKECEEELNLTRLDCDIVIHQLETKNQQLQKELIDVKSISASLHMGTFIPIFKVSIKTSIITLIISLGFIILVFSVYLRPDLTVEIKEPKSKWFKGLIIFLLVINILIGFLSLIALLKDVLY